MNNYAHDVVFYSSESLFRRAKTMIMNFCRNKFYKSFAFVLLCIGFMGCKEDPTSKPLIIGLSADYPPFEFTQSGTLSGFDVELAALLGKELNREVEIKDMDFSSLIPSLQSGRIDLILSSLSVTPERAENIDFSDIYYETEPALVVSTNSNITSFKDLAGKTVGVQLGTTLEGVLKEKQENQKDFTILSLSRIPELVAAQNAGRADALLLEASQAYALKNQNPSLTVILLENAQTGYAIGFKKGSTLRESVNQALKTLSESGKIKELKMKWIIDKSEEI